ncbi:hypothetical protein M3204_04180 [Mesobacillus subterraneus]|uniref:hypothetical protein n=1 Tax=Mesobacillus subterraneus TaxID=285983 RepID=UPI0020407969|nr:hypothetical protein [Mesobacillus subterraneus]MCM3663587.1 hypothetical protein [Mesobacillus subterraneus]MCM3683353.1 hypothetical protein [Mesobacillus subterraneus]
MSNQQLIQETLDSLQEFLPKIADTCLLVADQLRKDNESEAFHHIKEFIEAIDWSTQAVVGIKNLGYSLNVDTQEINEHLREVEDGLSVNDQVLIADLFEYEFHPKIQDWINSVNNSRANA